MPLMIFSAVTCEGKNVIVHLTLLPDETKATMIKALNDFVQLHARIPLMIISDFDKAFSATVDELFPEIPHLICHWHLTQNVAKNLGWLNNSSIKFMNYSAEERRAIYRKIINLLTIDSKT